MVKNDFDQKVPLLDLYPVHYKKEEIEYVVKMIKERNKDGEQLVLYTNCWCDIQIDGISVARQYDNLLYSVSGDVALLISRELNPEDLVSMLDKYNVPLFMVKTFDVEEDGFVDDSNIPGFYPVREKAVLQEATTAALEEFVNEADVYPNTHWSLNVGCSKGDEHTVLYSIGGRGLVDTGINCSLIIENGDDRNISPSNLEEEVKSFGFKTNVKEGHPSYAVQDPSHKIRK